MATAKLYGNAIGKAFNKEIDWDSDDIRVMLVTSAYTPDQDNHGYLSSITNEVSGTGYTAGGQALASKTINYDATNNVVWLDAADVTWTNSTLTARYAVVYDNSPATTATKPLIAYVDFVSDQSSSAGDFTLQWDATGIARVTIA